MIVLPGWFCPNPECGIFNGEGKEPRLFCRCCETGRPAEHVSLSDVQKLISENRELKAKVAIQEELIEMSYGVSEDE